MRLNLSLLLLIALASALPVQAQPSPVVNTPIPGADFLRSGGAEPDTTEPWRYYPLVIGNVWEYEDDEGGGLRVEVPTDTLIGGRLYFIQLRTSFDDAGTVVQGPSRYNVRFDTTTATVVEPYLDGSGNEVPFRYASCRLDAGPGDPVECSGATKGEVNWLVHDGVLAFSDTTVTGVTVKEYGLIASNVRYAAGFGEVYLADKFGPPRWLTYARIAGQEFGVEQFPVADEPGPPESEALALKVFPNPFRERLTVVLDLPQAGAARLEGVDVIGRVVRSRDLGVLPPGRHEVRLRTADLAAGPYLVRLVAGETLRGTQTVTRLR
jgi:hypothetical protein